MTRMSDDLLAAVTAADEANGGPIRRLRRTARSDRFNDGAARMLARYQRNKSASGLRRRRAEAQARVDALYAETGLTRF
jgi:hypothetical protein